MNIEKINFYSSTFSIIQRACYKLNVRFIIRACSDLTVPFISSSASSPRQGLERVKGASVHQEASELIGRFYR
jgi:hypothetical protein